MAQARRASDECVFMLLGELIEHRPTEDLFTAHFNERLRKRIRGLAPEVEETFRRYTWPGNVRELRNIIERVMILEDSDLITADWLPRGLVRIEGLVSPPPIIAAPQAAEAVTSSFQLAVTPSFKAFSACLFSRSLTVAVLYRARKQAVPEHQSRKCCKLPDEGIALEQIELSLARQAMERSGGNQTRAA